MYLQSLDADSIRSWMEKYTKWGAQPSAAGYVDLFAPAGTLYDSESGRPLPREELGAHMERVLERVPDLRLEPLRWRANGSTVFVEARNSGTIGGTFIEWPSVYGLTLDEDGVARGRRYYDRVPLLSHVVSDLPAAPSYEPRSDPALEGPEDGPATDLAGFVEQYQALWKSPVPRRFAEFYASDGRMINPGMERSLRRAEIPGYYEFVLALAPDLSMELLAWAGDEDLVFMEWQGTGTVAGRSLELPVVDRFDRLDGRVTHGQAYFDSSILLAHLDPSLAEKLRLLS